MARSMYRNQASSATLSKKLSTANGFYDDVFSGQAKVGAPTFSSRVEDYCEIFGTSQASRGSSIPVLDLPIANEREAPIDVRSSKFDYSKIFSGLGDVDFAAPSYEELFAEPKEGDSTSSMEAWTPAETGSPSEGSDVFNSSEENEVYEAAYQSFDSVKQFNMSYHRTNQRSPESTNETTHIAQFHAVPGYSCLIDEFSPLQKTESDTPVPTIVNDVKLNVDFSEGTKERKHCKTAMSHPPPCNAEKQASDGDANFRSGFDRNQSYSNDNLFSAYETRIHSSKLQPPNPNKKEDDYNKSMDSNFKASTSAPGGAADDCSSTSSDEEIDPNSAAAASAAAVRKAIENARARIRIARESMERKKAGLQSSGKLSFKDGLEFKEKRGGKVPASGSRYKEKATQITCERVDRTVPVFAGRERQNATETGQVVPGAKSREKVIIANKTAEAMHGTNSQQTQVDHGQEGADELEAAKLLYDQVNTHKSRAATLVFKHADGENKMIEAIDAREWKEKVMVKTNSDEPTENAKKMKIIEEAHKWEEIGNPIKGAQEWDANKLEAATELTEQEENEKKLRIGVELRETKEIENEEELKKCQQPIKRKGIDIQGWEETEEIENEEELKECQQPIKNEEEIDLQNWEEDETLQKRLEEGGPKQIENEEQKESYEQAENERRVSEVCGWVEHEEQPGEVCGQEENVKKHKDAPKGDSEKELAKVCEKETRLNVPHDWEESEKLLKEDHLWEGNENLEETQKLEVNEEMLKESYQMGENEKSQKEAHEWEETERTQGETDEIEENGQRKVTKEAIKYDGEKNLEATNNASEQDQAKNRSGTQEACTQKGNDMDMDVIEEVFADEENGRMMEVYESFCEPKENGNGLKPFKVENDLEEREMFEEARLTLDALKNREIKNSINDEVETFFLDANEVDLDEIDMNLGQEETDHNTEPELACNLEEHFKKLAPESGENNKHVNETEVALDEEEDEVSYGERQWVENGKKMEAGCVFEGKEMNMEMDQEINSSQITEGNKENAQDTFTIEGRETKETLQKEAEVEKEHFRRTNEAKEREREREKERIAVERAIREVRERAFAEAREKAEKAAAERATAGARQKVMAGAGERLNKASSGAKSLAEKASMEAKLRAERAAVERATAEARERALEKALSGKAASGAREQAERFAAAKKDPLYQGSGPSSNSRYSNSSNHGVPYATGFDEAKDEATQRCKAMSDRHQRTVERVAKVLEEKNMRDLLAQKEQAERNRLAEALDGGVKRWSSGKEGNLRALLATLQYILGPDSGWQPIPLTDIITTNAIKKAYRKATLCVHPDKLQQRGASIQQKYICEKVFDLLQEAWNKFNSEE